jgi:hypothetical protein
VGLGTATPVIIPKLNANETTGARWNAPRTGSLRGSPGIDSGIQCILGAHKALDAWSILPERYPDSGLPTPQRERCCQMLTSVLRLT